jgi:uncharacterized protein (DUF2147 family)
MLHCPGKHARTITYSVLLLASTLVPAFAADPTGDWRVADGVANIRVQQCNGNMWGALSWEKTPGGKDKNNPDVAKQSRPTLGMPILIEMKKKADTPDTWEGQVYNAKDGKQYDSTIKPVGNDKLEIQGCVLGFLCGGETWTRVAGPIPSSPVNSMAKGAPKIAPTAGAAAPKTTGAVNPAPNTAPKAHSQKMAAAGQPADPVGDICLIPDIARFAH